MGLFDLADLFASSNDTSYGYKTLKNTKGYTNESLLSVLRSAGSEFGEPEMGWIRAYGKEREVIVYSKAHKTNYIYVDADSKHGKIIISMAPKPGQIGGARDHMAAADGEEEDTDLVSNTIDCMPLVDTIIEVVSSIL
ncbi:MAG: hypothetical protein K6F79_10720 [Saccharofermentans sp.]|nr:hypothetical protein [Saccharofermentans sp.]